MAGGTYAFGVFDAVALTERELSLAVGAESTFVVSDSAAYDSTARAWLPVRFDTVRAFRIAQTTGGVATATVWIDGEGRIVRMEAPSGFTMERQAFEIAYQEFRQRDTTRMAAASRVSRPGDVIATTALAARAAFPRVTRPALRVRLSGVALDRLRLTGPGQRLAGDTLVVEQAAAAALAARYTLPARDSGFLRPEPPVQSGDPPIVTHTREIVGCERDPARTGPRPG